MRRDDLSGIFSKKSERKLHRVKNVLYHITWYLNYQFQEIEGNVLSWTNLCWTKCITFLACGLKVSF